MSDCYERMYTVSVFIRSLLTINDVTKWQFFAIFTEDLKGVGWKVSRYKCSNKFYSLVFTVG